MWSKISETIANLVKNLKEESEENKYFKILGYSRQLLLTKQDDQIILLKLYTDDTVTLLRI